MKPQIDKTKFGSITIAGEKYEYDVVIRPSGRIEKRKKKLSKAIYGTSHRISLAEAESIYEKGTERIIIGTGQSGMAELSPEARAFFEEQGCRIEQLPTPEAIRRWNESKGRVAGLFHITC